MPPTHTPHLHLVYHNYFETSSRGMIRYVIRGQFVRDLAYNIIINCIKL